MTDFFQNGTQHRHQTMLNGGKRSESTVRWSESVATEKQRTYIPGDELPSPVDDIRISQMSQISPMSFVLPSSDDYLLIARMSNRSETRYDFGKGSRIYEIRHGQILVRPLREQSMWWFGRPGQTMVLRISERALRNAWDNDTDEVWAGLVAMDTFRQDSLVAQAIARLSAELNRSRAINQAYIRSLLFQLTTDLVRRYSEPVSSSLKHSGMPPGRLRKVIAYISDQLEGDLRLSTLSHVAGVSHYYFCREFKKSMGITPQRYVIQQRIERAKALLETTRLSITAISVQLRFPTPSHFAATFRKMVGVTPTSYRL